MVVVGGVSRRRGLISTVNDGEDHGLELPECTKEKKKKKSKKNVLITTKINCIKKKRKKELMGSKQSC